MNQTFSRFSGRDDFVRHREHRCVGAVGLDAPCRTRVRLACLATLVSGCLWGLLWFAGESRAAPEGPAVDAKLIQELAGRLSDRRSMIRREAICRLAQFGPRARSALGGLKVCLDDADPFVRAHAARAVYRVGQCAEPAVEALGLLLQPDYPALCCLASLNLGEIGPAAQHVVPMLHRCLNCRDASVRLHAAEACLHINAYDHVALRELLAALEDGRVDNRYFAANALGAAALGNAQAQFALTWALTDPNANVAVAASLNLSKRFDLPTPAPGDEPALSSEEIEEWARRLRGGSEASRRAAAIKLGLAGAAAQDATGALRESLSDTSAFVRLHAAHALWQIGGEAGEIIPCLIDLLANPNPGVSSAAVAVLGEIGPPAEEALPLLVEVFQSSNPRGRLHLACMISRIDPDDEEMIGIVTAESTSTASDMRYQAVLALAATPVGYQHDVEPALEAAAADRNLRVQSAAADAIGRLQVRMTVRLNTLSALYSAKFANVEMPENGSASEETRTPPESDEAPKAVKPRGLR